MISESLMKMLNAVKKNFVETIDNRQIVKKSQVPYLDFYNMYLQQHIGKSLLLIQALDMYLSGF